MASTVGLNDLEREVLRFIREQVKQRGYPPTVREIGGHMGWSSSSTTHHHLNYLVRRGLLLHDPKKPRTLVVKKGVRL